MGLSEQIIFTGKISEQDYRTARRRDRRDFRGNGSPVRRDRLSLGTNTAMRSGLDEYLYRSRFEHLRVSTRPRPIAITREAWRAPKLGKSLKLPSSLKKGPARELPRQTGIQEREWPRSKYLDLSARFCVLRAAIANKMVS